MWKSLWKDPVWSAVIAAAILAVAGAVGTYLLDLWPSIGKFLGRTIEFAQEASTLPNWQIGLLVLFAFPTLLAILLLLWAAVRPGDTAVPDWTTYTSDNFFGLRWRWHYLGGASLSELVPFCPHCDFQVYPENASGYAAVDRIAFRCDSCNRDLGAFEEPYRSLEDRARRFVQQKLRNNTWNKQSGT